MDLFQLNRPTALSPRVFLDLSHLLPTFLKAGLSEDGRNTKKMRLWVRCRKLSTWAKLVTMKRNWWRWHTQISKKISKAMSLVYRVRKFARSLESAAVNKLA